MRLRKLLVVDDDPLACDILRKFLVDKGYNVVVTFKSDRTLAIYKQEQPDAVLLDIRMPVKQGLEVLRELKAFDTKVRVIMVSAVFDDEVIEQAKDLGALGYVKKPINPHHLVQLLVRIDHSVYW